MVDLFSCVSPFTPREVYARTSEAPHGAQRSVTVTWTSRYFWARRRFFFPSTRRLLTGSQSCLVVMVTTPSTLLLPPPPTLQQVATSSHEHVSSTELGGRLRPRLTSTYVSEGRVEYGAGCYTSLTARPDEGGGEGLVYPGPGLWLGLGQWIIFL